MIECNDNHDDKEMEVHLDIAAGKMHQHRRGGDQTKVSNSGTKGSTKRASTGQERHSGDDSRLSDTVYQSMPQEYLGTCDADDM